MGHENADNNLESPCTFVMGSAAYYKGHLLTSFRKQGVTKLQGCDLFGGYVGA
jgi:hypothetical protein